MRWPGRTVFVLAVALSAACGVEPDVAHTTYARTGEPVGEKTSVFENPMHAIHLSGTTPILCSRCHDIDRAEFAVPAAERCVDCHTPNEAALHETNVTCVDCHKFAAGDPTEKDDCQFCHGKKQDEHLPITVHAKVDCRNCHVAHGTPKLAVESCLTCHEDHQQGHGKPELTVIERCVECHPPHTKSIEAVARCQDCHAEKLLRAVFRGHNKCDTCHKGDRRSAPEKPAACASCHGGRTTLAENKVAKHKECTSCHAPHDPRGTAVQSCRRCHSGVTPKHPKDPKSGSCLGCHPAHPRSAENTAKPCSSCHRGSSGDLSLHAPTKTSCSDCHEAHAFEPPACSSCHQTQLKQTATADGHKKCASCHLKPHAPKAKDKTCAGCHVSEYETAKAGHQDCAKCHDPHSGRRLAKARCETCHKERLDMTHGRIDGGCTSCHRAHGPGGRATPPSCASCHSRKRLPNLHVVKEHGDCATCHEGHGLRDMTRAVCMDSCHTDKSDHETVAKTCVGCHPFGGSR